MTLSIKLIIRIKIYESISLIKSFVYLGITIITIIISKILKNYPQKLKQFTSPNPTVDNVTTTK